MKRFLLILFLTTCVTGSLIAKAPISGLATEQTRRLYRNLDKIARKHILFGHQDANAYGHTWQGESDRSDVKDVCGSHPAVYGFDLGNLFGPGREHADSVLRICITEAYRRGGVITLSWHYPNPANGGSFMFKHNPEISVPRILPGGNLHDKYRDDLCRIAAFATSLRGDEGELIPVIFRPFHEFDGEWFWWGKTRCTREEFLVLWKFTVDYLKDELKIRNFLYAFSPDCRFDTWQEFADYYPGDEYVDLVGMDNYWDFRSDGGSVGAFARKIRIVSDFARKHRKLAALTETGLEGIPDSLWWTGTLLRELKSQKLRLCYVLVWRNAYDNPTHFYAPFPGQAGCMDFIRFRQDSYLIFETDIPDMYK